MLDADPDVPIADVPMCDDVQSAIGNRQSAIG
jgi:hypothetical protein